MSSPAIGIDLGTTYSCVGVWQFEHGRVKILDTGRGGRTMASCVSFIGNQRIIGEEALAQMTTNPENTIVQVKRLMGRKYNDEVVQAYKRKFKVKISEHIATGKPQFEVMYQGQKKTFLPEEVSAMILGRLKTVAEEFLGCKISQAVITVPAYFNAVQRQATNDAGKIAGLNVLRLINEPTSAAVAYGLDEADRYGQTAVIFDLGGGTFDVSIMDMQEDSLDVLGTNGDTELGGEDFSAKLVDRVTKDFKSRIHGDVSNYQRELNALYLTCERAKRHLTSEPRYSIPINTGQQNFKFEFTREDFEKENIDAFQRCINLVDEALKDAKVSKRKVNSVVLVGGSSVIPKIRHMLADYFGGSEKLVSDINADEAVAYGAAIQAAVLSNNECRPYDLPVLLDITPLSLGVSVIGGRMSFVVRKNTKTPCKITRDHYSTVYDNQEVIRFDVYQGEREMVAENQWLGGFILKNIRIAEKGVPQVSVTFDIDESGMMKVSAFDQDTGGQSEIQIDYEKYKLSTDEIHAMEAEAKKMETFDKQERARIEARLSLEDALYDKKKEKSVAVSLRSRVEEIERWLQNHQNASRSEFVKQKDILMNMFT
eukprot:TRINITY_DN15973_c0_g1_i11.p1 TRINITY_DN15973_c0_g1~~TRINITY_DN15973_c0_g1_i11.p1  ORF type:complete len:597 (+),score=111.29 TRINITY_DN15973_c0_g1_i11:153-1943(+)